LVICHTDLHGANLLVDPADELYILDWENAMLAPPEQDLFFFAGDERFWTLFWPNYAREFEGAGLDADTLAFYMYRRGLEDLADWLQRLFAGVDDDETERRAVHWAGETVDELAGVEARLGRVADRGKPR
jgi:aminoglycoside phosphotransferase (APT) family kinase protein